MRDVNGAWRTVIAIAGAIPATFVAALAYLLLAPTNDGLGDTMEFALLVTFGLVRQALGIGAVVGIAASFANVTSAFSLFYVVGLAAVGGAIVGSLAAACSPHVVRSMAVACGAASWALVAVMLVAVRALSLRDDGRRYF